MAKQKMDWIAWRAAIERGDTTSLVVRNDYVIALLDSRDALAQTIEDIITACPKRPTKAFAKTILEIATTGRNAAKNGNS